MRTSGEGDESHVALSGGGGDRTEVPMMNVFEGVSSHAAKDDVVVEEKEGEENSLSRVRSIAAEVTPGAGKSGDGVAGNEGSTTSGEFGSEERINAGKRATDEEDSPSDGMIRSEI